MKIGAHAKKCYLVEKFGPLQNLAKNAMIKHRFQAETPYYSAQK
jgi:hypothetical protein